MVTNAGVTAAFHTALLGGGIVVGGMVGGMVGGFAIGGAPGGFVGGTAFPGGGPTRGAGGTAGVLQ